MGTAMRGCGCTRVRDLHQHPAGDAPHLEEAWPGVYLRNAFSNFIGRMLLALDYFKPFLKASGTLFNARQTPIQ